MMLQGRQLLGMEVDGPHHGDALDALTGIRLGRRSTWFRLVDIVGFAGVAGFVVAVVALHSLRGNLDPADHTISEYSLARYGWLMRGAFASLGLGAVATAVGLRLRFEPSARRYLGLLLLVATAVGLCIEAGFNTDRLGVPETFDGSMHGAGMLIVCLTLPAVGYILGGDLVRSCRGVRTRWIQALGPAQLIAIIGFEVSPMAYRGLAERIAVTLGVAILALLQSLVIPRAGEWGADPSLTYREPTEPHGRINR